MNDPTLDVTEMAFDRSEGYFFAGSLLEPFSSRRRRAADSLGLRYFKLGGDDWAKFSSEKTYDGIEQDAAVLLWVCTQSPERLARAMVYRDAAIEEMNAWADGAQIAPGEDKHGEAIDAFSQIIMDVINSQFESAEEKKGGDDEPGKSLATQRDTRSPQQQQREETWNGSGGTSHLPEDSNTSPPMSGAKVANLQDLETISDALKGY